MSVVKLPSLQQICPECSNHQVFLLVLSCRYLFRSYLVLSCLAVICFVLVLSCLVLSCLVLSCLALPCLVLSCLALPCLVLSCLSIILCLFLLFQSSLFWPSSRLAVSRDVPCLVYRLTLPCLLSYLLYGVCAFPYYT